MSREWPAGIIRKTPVTPTGPYQDGTAPGVWTLDQMTYWLKQSLWPIAGNVNPIGLFAGGNSGAASNVIDKINIATTGNATDFGDLTLGRISLTGASSSTRATWAGGQNDSSTKQSTIYYSTISTSGNTSSFGNLSVARQGLTGASNETRAVFGGGQNSTPAAVNVIDYITIASTGNATDFGDLLAAYYYSVSYTHLTLPTILLV